MAALGGRFTTIRFDLRGHGESSKPPGPYSAALFAEDARALLDHLGIGRCHVAGHSLGATVALRLALDAPDRVERLALLSAAAGRTEEERQRVLERLAIVEHGIPGRALPSLAVAVVLGRVPARQPGAARAIRGAQHGERPARLRGGLSRPCHGGPGGRGRAGPRPDAHRDGRGRHRLEPAHGATPPRAHPGIAARDPAGAPARDPDRSAGDRRAAARRLLRRPRGRSGSRIDTAWQTEETDRDEVRLLRDPHADRCRRVVRAGLRRTGSSSSRSATRWG